MAVDLHPDIVAAINQMAQTKLGRKYGKWAKREHGISGKKLMAKTVAGEFGGRSTKSGAGVVSSAGARGPAQFIPSTRSAYISQYGVDPWKSDRAAMKGMMIHHMGTGVAGYNPGMPTYTDYILGQKINPADIQALRTGAGGPGGGGGSMRLPGKTEVTVPQMTVPGVSYADERRDARRQLLLGGGGLTMDKLLAYKRTVSGLKDIPDRKVSGDIQVEHTKGKKVKLNGQAGTRDGVPQGWKGKKGGIYEVFYDPLNEYWDSGGVQKGAIGDHSDHVHVSADRGYIVKLGRLAQRMGLRVGEQRRFGGTPTGGHTSGSFHYRDMGIDVSGDPAAMEKFARLMMREAQRGHGR